MRIRSIETIGLEFVLSRERAYGSAAGIHPRRQVTLVRVITEDGVEGFGEARGAYNQVKANIDHLSAYFLGTNILERELTWVKFTNRAYHHGHQGGLTVAYSGLNIAMLDALGKTLGLPVCRLIGGMARTEVSVYATGGYLTHGPLDRYEEQLEALRVMRLPIAKIKIGLGPKSDEDRVAMARQCLGEGVRIAVDANANYTTDVALESMKRIAPYGIAWFEEPLKPYDIDGFAFLRARANIAISAGEALHTSHDFRLFLEMGCIDIAQPAVCACGGMDEARRIADLCRLHSTRIVASAWASGVGLAAAIQFAASIPQYPHSYFEPTPQLVEYDVGENPLREEILVEPLEVHNGAIAVPTQPGLGISVNQDTIKRYAIA